MIDRIKIVYFLGIGGIGMSAIARYFAFHGKTVLGYDKTPSSLTDALESEGMKVHFEDNVSNVPEFFKNAAKTEVMVVYTPAIPKDSAELNYFIDNGYTILKRAVVLGEIVKHKRGIAVAGTHGKTTVSTLISHLLHTSAVGCSSFLGGISKNYGTNLLLSDKSEFVVAEADEFDRSFLSLNPWLAVITSVDADHLDIYSNKQNVKDAFTEFTGKIQNGGTLIIKNGVELNLANHGEYKVYTYSLESQSDFYASNLRLIKGQYVFDLVCCDGRILNDIAVGLPGKLNAENAVVAIAAAYLCGASENDIRTAVATFKGNSRRFDVQFSSDSKIYIDDYAHHPEELRAFITSVKELYSGKKITGIFQPHLYTRTRDFAVEFAESLSLLDELILLDIYPARELPIEGVSSEIIYKNVVAGSKTLCMKHELMSVLKNVETDVLLTMGAGDIDRFVAQITELIKKKDGQ